MNQSRFGSFFPSIPDFSKVLKLICRSTVEALKMKNHRINERESFTNVRFAIGGSSNKYLISIILKQMCMQYFVMSLSCLIGPFMDTNKMNILEKMFFF